MLTKKKSMKLILLITIFATLLRLFFFLDFHSCCGSDEGLYHYTAQNLAFHNTFMINDPKIGLWKDEIYAIKPPLYPFFMAGIYKFISPSYKAVEIVQVLLSILTGLLIYLISTEFISKRVGLIALIIYSFFLETAYMSVSILSENIYWLLLSLYIYLLIRMKKYTANFGILIGVISGLLILVRPPSATFILPIIIWYLWKNINLRTMANSAAIIFFCLVTLLPWTIRNYQVYGQFIFIYTDGGINVWMGNHEGSSGGYRVVKADDPNQTPVLKTEGVMQEVERDNFYYNKSKEFILNNPLEALDLSVKKVFSTFSLYRRAAVVWTITGKKPNPLRPPVKSFDSLLEFIISYQYAIIILLSAIGAYYLYAKKLFSTSLVLILILIACHLISIAISHWEFRYIMQLYPLIIPLAAVGVGIMQEVLSRIKLRDLSK